MARSSFLFDMEPYSVPPKRGRPRSMPERVRWALFRLKKTLDSVPNEEMEERRLRWESLCRSQRPASRGSPPRG